MTSTCLFSFQVEVWRELEDLKLKRNLERVLAKGIKSLAVCLMHSYTFRDHEIKVGKLAKELGFEHVSLSHETMPMVRIVPRGFTGWIGCVITTFLYLS